MKKNRKIVLILTLILIILTILVAVIFIKNNKKLSTDYISIKENKEYNRY